jgi:predicted metalloprotease with PDZ domain
LASWRPGRYEMGNFAKNVSHILCLENGNTAKWKKVAKDIWEIDCSAGSTIEFSFNYSALELNAGSTYANSKMLYVNPVNCIPFLPQNIEESYEINISGNYKFLSTGLTSQDLQFYAKNFDELADSPFVACNEREVFQFVQNSIQFEVHLFGETSLDRTNLLQQIEKYTAVQMEIFGGFPEPVERYLYLLHFTPHFMHHGVEHTTSTVIVMGPGDSFDKPEKHNELLAICSHELFHTWNVKTLRPIEMVPYDFTKENYTQLGYVAEGVTTYYGDLCLVRSNVWDLTTWKISCEDWLNAHHKNYGRFSYSLANSSIDTWLDGYSAGVPWRKVSIYNEGALLTMYLDLMLLLKSNGTISMDNVISTLFDTYALPHGTGYAVHDFWKTIELHGLANAQEIRETMAEQPCDLSKYLEEVWGFFDVELSWTNSNQPTEQLFGFSVDISQEKSIITSVVPHSAADWAGLWYGDEIIEIDGISVSKNVQFLLENTMRSTIRFIRNKVEFETEIHFDKERPTIKKANLVWPSEPNKLFQSWVGQRFK